MVSVVSDVINTTLLLFQKSEYNLNAILTVLQTVWNAVTEQ